MLLLLTAFLAAPLTAFAAQGVWKAQAREFAEPPGRSERAIQTWRLATTNAQPEAVIKDLQNRLLTDPESEVRLAAAWALGHLRVTETGESAHAYDRPPVIDRKSQKPVSYPPEAWTKRVQGTVMIESLIDERGLVVYAEVRGSIPALDEAALAQVKQWRFKAATFGDTPVAVMARTPVAFRVGK